MRKPTKLTRAQQALAEEERRMLDKWSNVPRFARTPARRQPVQASFSPALTAPPGRETPRLPSRITPGGACTKPVESLQYTGGSMLGIGTLHKSNAVPVFSGEQATEMARMRRG